MTRELGNSGGRNPFVALRQLSQQVTAQSEEQCDLCGERIGPEHRHLLRLDSREVLCACRACAVLLDAPAAGGGARRLIPTRRLCLTEFAMSDAQWASLQVPVNMAFFSYTSVADRWLAFYPSPMGPTEAVAPAGAWEELARRNPILNQVEPDVEALLVRREKERSETYLVPIDACYQLVGLIRVYWKGLSGGSEVRQAIDRYFLSLREQATRAGGPHA